MTYLRHMTNEELKTCLLNDMEMLRDGSWVPTPHDGDDSVDATVAVIEEVFRRIDIYSKAKVYPTSEDRHALSNKLIINALKRGDIQ